MISTSSLQTCNNSSLDIYVPTEDNPWNIQKINHLYRRVAFGATPAMREYALGKTPTEIIDELIIQSQNATPTEAPIWLDWSLDDFKAAGQNVAAAKTALLRDIVSEWQVNDGGINDRLTLFWSNHLVASYQGYYGAPHVYRYINLLQRYALGNFKDFVREIGINSAMLYYLNGYENKKDSPNENYARELLELFTLGVDNGYTQDDIVEISRALTGWNENAHSFSEITFNPDDFDTETKTFFGKTGAWGYDDVIDILFEEREGKIAEYMCRKLYAYFVSSTINESIVTQLAVTFVNNNFEILPVIEQLIRSEHFFDVTASTVIVKSPIDLDLCFNRELDVSTGTNYNLKLYYGVLLLGQPLFDYESVEGWQGEDEWINSSTLVNRWETMEARLNSSYNHNSNQFQEFLNELLGGESNDVEFVTQSVLNFFFSNPSTIDEITFQGALVAFKNNVPQNYFDDGSWNTGWGDTVPDQIYMLMLYIIRLPEFQLK